MSLEKSLEILREYIEVKRKLRSLTREDIKVVKTHFNQDYESKIIQLFSHQLQQFNESFKNVYLVKLNINDAPDHYFSIEVLRRLKSSEANSKQPLEYMVASDWIKQARKDEKVCDKWLGEIAEITRHLGYDPNSMSLIEALILCKKCPHIPVPIPEESMDIQTFDDIGGLNEILSGGIDGEWDYETLQKFAENSCYSFITIFRLKEKENYQQGFALLGINKEGEYKIEYLSAELPKLPKKSKEYLEFSDSGMM